MNLDKKLELAHEYAKILLTSGLSGDWNYEDYSELADDAFMLADAMEAEYKKREEEQREKDAKESKSLFDILTKNEDGSCKHFHTTLNKGECFDCGEKLNSTNSSQLDWQPDWNVAPVGFDWWAIDEDVEANWYRVEPYVDNGDPKQWDYDDCNCHVSAPSFNYQGDWKQSLRKRPK